jgi:iron complex outermembrane receptor protein
MKFTLRGASSAALIIGVMGSAAWAQEAPTAPTESETVQAAPQDEPPAVEQTVPEAGQTADLSDRIVVTGSLVAGASEDAPLPVEVYSLEDMTQQGAPTASEFLRSLSISSEAQGEADSQIAGAAAGFANVNLRGLGASRTLVLLNGKRFASTDGGAGADINTLPMMAVGRIDVLKDGASVTYGAGAVGGVVNYITRKDFDGFEISASKKMFDGSKGEDDISALWGVTGDSSNLMIAASYGKRHPLGQVKRDFATLDYQDQPAGWGLFNNNPSNYYNAGAAFANIRDYTTSSCNAVGGQIASSLNSALNTSGTGGAPASNAGDCAIWLAPYFNLIDEEIYTRGYIEYNSDLNDSSEFHFELAYAKTDNPNIEVGSSLPSGGNRALDTARTSAIGLFQVPYSQTTYNTAGVATGAAYINPFAAEFYNRAVASGLVSPSTVRGALLTSNQWRPLMAGGNPLFGGHRVESQERERWGGSMGLKGEFTDDGLLGLGRFLPEGTTFEYAATYSKYINTSSRPDWLVSRLQNALRGYGGPSCNAVDRVATNYTSSATFDASVGIQSDTAPGTNGCEYFNPFASSFATSFINGAANPAYGGAGYENSIALLDWLTHDRRFETTNEALTIDAVYTGIVPGIELPGGEIGWALGSQWRQTESRGLPLGTEEEIQTAGLDCPWGDQGLPATFPGQGACIAQSGPYFGSGIGRQFPFMIDRQTMSYFGELQIPVLDNLNFQVAARREEFGDITGNIWKVAGKYDILPELSFRASYSTNFQAPPEDIGILGTQPGSVYVGSLLRAVPTLVTTVPGITPEDDTGSNIGVIWAPEVGGGQLRASVDFWEFTVLGEIANTNLTTVLSNVFGTTAPNNATAANCAAKFINLVNFVTGSCTAGVTAGQIESIEQYTLNTGGFITNGLDYNIDYSHDLGPGEILAALSATQTTIYKVKGFGIPGVVDEYQPSFDGLGWANLTRAGTIMPEWRGNASLRYTFDNETLGGTHSFGLRMNYISGFEDESTPVRVGAGPDGVVDPANDPAPDDIYATYGMAASDYTDFDFTYLYNSSIIPDLQLRLSVLNLTDEDPMAAQNTNAGGASATRTGYYPGYGNPRGRQIEIGVTKKF